MIYQRSYRGAGRRCAGSGCISLSRCLPDVFWRKGRVGSRSTAYSPQTGCKCDFEVSGGWCGPAVAGQRSRLRRQRAACGASVEVSARYESMTPTRGDAAAVPASSKAPRVGGNAPRRGALIVAKTSRLVRAMNGFDCSDPFDDPLTVLVQDQLSGQSTCLRVFLEECCTATSPSLPMSIRTDTADQR